MLILPPVDSGTTTLANFERGVYEPSTEARDGARVFDGSEEEEDVEGSRLPLLIVLALLVLAMFAGVVWLAYTQGVARGRGETPVLTAANGPERVAPQDGGGNVPYQGFKIYEQPAPPDDSAEAPAAAAAKPAPVAVTPAPPPPVVKAEAPPAPKPAPAKIEPAPVKPAPAKTETPPKSVAALIQQANSEPVKPAPAPKAPPPAAKPAPAPAQATGAPRSLTPPQQVAANAPAKLAAPAAAASGSYMLQIGAFKSQAEAAAAWKTYQGKHAALLSGYSDNVQQADLGEKGTWYRLRIGGFADKEVATALCDRLKADGGACMLGR
jgi:hypothetical protein